MEPGLNLPSCPVAMAAMQVAPQALAEGVASAFPGSPVSVGVATLAHQGRDRALASEVSIGGESVLVALVAEGVGEPSAVEWCAAHVVSLFVQATRDDPSAPSLQRAGHHAFAHAHSEVNSLLQRKREQQQQQGSSLSAAGPSACTVTLCAFNRLRHEVTTCNLGASAALLFGARGGRTTALSDDHRVASSQQEQRRLQELGVHLQCAQDAHGRPSGTLRAWPPGADSTHGVACARAIGSLGSAVDSRVVCAVPSCCTMAVPASGADLLICSDGVWNELLVSAVAALARTCPTPSAAAKIVVESAVAQHTSYYQAGYGVPRDDATSVVLRIGPSASSASPRRLPAPELASDKSASRKAASLIKRTSSSLLKRMKAG